MSELYQDIFDRWVKAIDEMDTIAAHRENVSIIKYASSIRYDLSNYSKSNFPVGGKVFDENPDEESDYRRYGLDHNGQPVYVFFEHSWNKISWEGIYNYSDNQVEYLEFCINTNVPSCVKVIKYENGRKISYQHFNINGGGSGLPLLKDGKEAYIESIQSNEYSVNSYIEKYIYEGERIIKADCFAVSPGIGQFSFEKSYTYDDQGELAEIRILYPATEVTMLEYVKIPDDLNMDDLINNLAEKMSGSIIETLLKKGFEEPIVLLELFYRRVERYCPFLKVRFLSEKEELIRMSEDERKKGLDLFELFFLSGSGELINVDHETIERPLLQLMQLMDAKENFNPGTTMLRKTALLLTQNKLNGKLPVSDDFVAYAIDWEMDGRKFEEILMECGQTPEIIQNWRAKGLLPKL
jgi:hypothetical protein